MKIINFIILLMTCCVIGCCMTKNVISASGFELKVTNLSGVDIYPTVISKKSKERFGVVSVGKSATVGFSSFNLGGKLEISWEEGESYDLSYATIDTSKIENIKNNAASVHLIYHGGKNWVLKAFDKNDTQLGSVP